MAFFELPKDEDLPLESLKMLDEYQRLRGSQTKAANWLVFGRSPKIIEARLLAWKNLSQDSSFSFDARNVAVMLIAHAKGCQMCFAGARSGRSHPRQCHRPAIRFAAGGTVCRDGGRPGIQSPPIRISA